MNKARVNANNRIRVGYLKGDDFFNVCSGMKRCMTELIEKLEKDKRFELVDIEELNRKEKYFNSQELIMTYIQLMSSEGGLKNFYRLLDGDRILKEYNLMCKMAMLPSWLRGVVGWMLSLLGEHRLGWLVNHTAKPLTYD